MNSLALLPRPPFEISIPERVQFFKRSKAVKFVNNFNGIKRIFYSLYSFRNTVLDKIWFDMDSDQGYKNVEKFINWCEDPNNKYKYIIVFSGGGWHFYLLAKNEIKLKDPKSALTAIHNEIIDKLGFSCSIDAHNSDIDGHIIGDIRRVVTLPGTLNTKRGRWAISVTKEEFYKGEEYVRELANTQRFEIYTYGENLFDVDAYKDVINIVNYANIIIPDMDVIRPEKVDADIKIFPLCIQNILRDVESKGNYKGRWIFTIWAKEYGLEPEDINFLAEKYFGQVQRSDGNWTNYDHWRKVKAVDYVFRKDQDMPSCEKMFIEGFCPGKCRFYMKRD